MVWIFIFFDETSISETSYFPVRITKIPKCRENYIAFSLLFTNIRNFFLEDGDFRLRDGGFQRCQNDGVSVRVTEGWHACTQWKYTSKVTNCKSKLLLSDSVYFHRMYDRQVGRQGRAGQGRQAGRQAERQRDRLTNIPSKKSITWPF